jgi:ATP-dependent helicase/nuclease subunit B
LSSRVVVPSERHVERMASGSLVFETLTTLQSRLLAELAPDRTIAPPEVARAALIRALELAAHPGSFLEKAALAGPRAWLRTVDAVDAALALVRQTGCVDAIARIAREENGERARVLLHSHRTQDETLARLGHFEARAVNEVLCAAIGETTPQRLATVLGATELFARFVVSWQPSELALWRALDRSLAPLGGRAVIELPTFDVALDSARTSSALDRLSDEIAAALDDAPVTVPIEARLGDFRFLDTSPPDATDRVRLEQAADAAVQAWAVAEAVHDALARGLAPERIAILVPTAADEVLRSIRGTLAEIGVVAHDSRGRAPATSPLVAFALRTLEVADDGLRRADLASLVRSRYADARALSGLTDEAQARAVLRSVAEALESTPRARADDPVQAVELTALASTMVARRTRGADRSLSKVAGYAAALLRRAVLGRTRAEHATRARALWSALGLAAQAVRGARELLARELSPTGIARAELEAIAFDAQAWEAVALALDAYEAAAAKLGVAKAVASNETFRTELLHILGAPSPKPASGRAGAVRLVRAADVAGEPLDLLVIADFNDGVFPPRASLPAFFSTAFDERLRELDARFPTTSSQAARGLAELALAVCAAERIVLIHRARDEAGAILAPAPIFGWLERGGKKVEVCHASALRNRPLTVAQAELRELARSPERAQALAPSAARRARREQAREAFFSGGAIGDRAEDIGALVAQAPAHRVLAEETGGAGTPMAVTSLERFAACAFQGYASQVLGARELRANADAPDAREQGSIVHGALAAAFRATVSLWAARPRDEGAIVRRALEAADDFLQRGASSSGLRRLALDEARRDVLRVVEWSLKDEDWDFSTAEQPFGDGRPGSWESLMMDREGARLLLRGTIDRVDVGHNAAAVRAIDYKLSESAAARGTRGLGEVAFQLPLYARAAALHYEARTSDALYLPTRVKGPLPQGPTKAHAEAWARACLLVEGRASFETRALEIIQAVRAGGLAPTPADPHVCESCSFDGGCRKPRFAISAEREDEPER